MVTDPVGDMLTIIRNGYMAKKSQVLVPYSKFKIEIAQVLEKEKFVAGVKKEESKIKIDLAYSGKKPKLSHVKKISKPGLRVYTKSKNIRKVKGGKGVIIISTPKGVMTANVAKTEKLGGEVIAEVW